MRLKLLALVALLSASLPLHAESPAKKPTFAETITDPRYLRQALGPKAYVTADKKTGEPAAKAMATIRKAHLDEGVEFIPLPKDATMPKPKVRNPPEYPASMRSKRLTGEANFLFLIGADGTVQAIYCDGATDLPFAVAGAAAIAKWRFEPAKVGGKPIALLAGQLLEFNAK